MELYKYVTPNRIDIFKNKTIRFTQVMELNDPFESEPYYKDYKPKNPFKLLSDLSNILNHYKNTGEPLREKIKEYEEERKRINKDDIYRFLNDRIVGLSLTENKDNLLMWSLYANDHKGLMIEFDTKHKFFTKNNRILFKTNYDQKRFEVETIQFANSVIKLVDSIETQQKLTEKELNELPLIFSKSIDWIYENEWRLITSAQFAKNFKSFQKRKFEINLTGDAPLNRFYNNDFLALFDIPLTCIKSIYCGLRVSKNLAKQLYLLKHNNQEFSHINLFNTEMSEQYFQLNHRELEDYDVLTIGELEKNKKR